jgi:hypothetical protein
LGNTAGKTDNFLSTKAAIFFSEMHDCKVEEMRKVYSVGE